MDRHGGFGLALWGRVLWASMYAGVIRIPTLFILCALTILVSAHRINSGGNCITPAYTLAHKTRPQSESKASMAVHQGTKSAHMTAENYQRERFTPSFRGE
eukprot:8637380-Pyramimonas_sp.AAC.1